MSIFSNLISILKNNGGPIGCGIGRENIPTGSPLGPEEGIEYTIAGNKFLGNKQGEPLDYTIGSHAYFQ